MIKKYEVKEIEKPLPVGGHIIRRGINTPKVKVMVFIGGAGGV